jgi:hypothetical protein
MKINPDTVDKMLLSLDGKPCTKNTERLLKILEAAQLASNYTVPKLTAPIEISETDFALLEGYFKKTEITL